MLTLQRAAQGVRQQSTRKICKVAKLSCKKLSKQGQKVKLEVAKDTLFEAALAVKRAEKAVEKK